MPEHKAILDAVEAAFAHEPRLNLQRFPVRLCFADGVLSLDGEVEDIAAKKLALERAAAVPGVEGLVDRLRVAPSIPMSDEAIRDHVRAALYQEPALATFALNVGGREGVVPSDSIREMAEFDTWYVFVDRVINRLAIQQ